MSVFAETIPPAQVRDRSIEARRAARIAKAQRERRIVDLMNRGVSVAEIAAREEVTEKRMRALVSEILARRMPEPPAEFLALQVNRLNEALLVAFSAMSGANLQAVDRVVKIVRELDRYHGFFADGRRVLRDARLEHEDRLALAPPLTDRPETAAQVFEKAAPGKGAAPDASNPQDAAPAQEPPALDPPPTDRPQLPSCDASPCHPRESGGPDRQPQASPTGSHVTPMSAAVRWTPVFTGVTMEAPDPQDAAPIRDEASSSFLETPAQESLALDAPPTNRPEAAPQELEKAQSAPGNGRGGTWARPLGGASFVSPAVASPAAFRRVNIRATPNGMAAC